jgi:hypothetical protein
VAVKAILVGKLGEPETEIVDDILQEVVKVIADDVSPVMAAVTQTVWVASP